MSAIKLYKTYKAYSPEKDKINTSFSLQVAKIMRGSPEKIVLILDSAELCTTRALLHVGVPAKSIHIIERGFGTYGSIKGYASALGIDHVHCTDVFDVMKRMVTGKASFAGIFLDLMSPNIDIETLGWMSSNVKTHYLLINFTTRCPTLGCTVAERVSLLQGFFNSRFVLREAYGYGKMMLLTFQDKKTLLPDEFGGTVYRPKKAHERYDDHVLVQWWGYPAKHHWTWESEDILAVLEKERNTMDDMNVDMNVEKEQNHVSDYENMVNMVISAHRDSAASVHIASFMNRIMQSKN